MWDIAVWEDFMEKTQLNSRTEEFGLNRDNKNNSKTFGKQLFWKL